MKTISAVETEGIYVSSFLFIISKKKKSIQPALALGQTQNKWNHPEQSKKTKLIAVIHLQNQ